MDIWAWVAAERLRRGWSQSELARRAGVSAQLISAAEQGRKPQPSAETLAGLARAFGITMDELRVAAQLQVPAPANVDTYLAAFAALGVPPAVLAELADKAQYIEEQDWDNLLAIATRRAEKHRAAQQRQEGRRDHAAHQRPQIEPDHEPSHPAAHRPQLRPGQA